jgi:uncharacterized membrane protein
MTSTDSLVTDYLRRLEQASADLPAAEREELLDQIRGHLADACADERVADPTYLRQVLDDLGTPHEVAAAAREQAPGSGAATSSIIREDVAVVLLTIGWLLGGVGWLVGVFLAWTSSRWSRTEKVIATVLVGPIMLGFLISHDLMAHDAFSGTPAVADVLAVVALLAGLVGSLYLGAMLRRRAQAVLRARG